MAETSKKRSRKSKLVPRDDEEIEENERSSERKQKKTLPRILPKLLDQLKKDNEEMSRVDSELPTPQFSINVEVEVEECNDDHQGVSDLEVRKRRKVFNQETPSTYKEKKDGRKEKKNVVGVVKIPMYVIKKEIEEVSKTTTTIADKQLEIEIFNSWGKILIPIEEDAYETTIQTAIMSWRAWNYQSKIRETVLLYKCYICSQAWWHLHQFREHIRGHHHVIVTTETFQHECCIVANQFEHEVTPAEGIQLEGDCWRCLKSYSDHCPSVRQSDLYYFCKACKQLFFTCTSLIKHEGVCQRYAKMFLKDQVRHEHDYECDLCDTNWLTKSKYDAHMIARHSVRSDVPIQTTPGKKCGLCQTYYFVYHYHVCPKKLDNISCQYCCRKFQNTQLAVLHENSAKSNVCCRVCLKPLQKQCMEMEHMLKHSDNYMLVYRCLSCPEVLLCSDENALKFHRMEVHCKKLDKRRSFCDPMVVPIKCMMKGYRMGEQEDFHVDIEVADDSSQTSDELKRDIPTLVPRSYTNKKKHKLASKTVPNLQINEFRHIINSHTDEHNPIGHKGSPENSEINHEDKIIKQETDVVETGDVKNQETVQIDNVQIKQEKDDEDFEDTTIDIFKKFKNTITTQDDDSYVNTLSKVFQVSKNVKDRTTPSTTDFLSLQEELIIKDEPIDDDIYEDDIIIFNTSDVSQEADAGVATEPDSDIDLSNLEPEVSISLENQRKTYSCKKCPFQGLHRAYKEHTQCCLGRKRDINIKKVENNLWGTYKCTKCDRIFYNMKHYVVHFSEYHSMNSKCPHCHLVYTRPSGMVVHLNSAIKQSFVKIQLIKDSVEAVPKSSGFYQCRVCAGRVVFDDFFKHWETHLGLQDVKKEKESSDNEQEATASPTALASEMLKELIEILQMSPQESRTAESIKQCLVCGRRFVRRNDCKRHLIEHLLCDAYAHKPRLKALRCQMCHRDFASADLYKRHMRDHGSLPIYKCELCDKAFSDSSNFAKHKKVHNLQVMVCDICGKKFNARLSIEKHMEMHRTTAPIPCRLCDRSFYYMSEYRRHTRAAHVKPPSTFMCPICRSRFKRLRDKWDHMWRVHQERKHQADCPMCDKSFRKFQDVRLHVKVEHKVEVSVLGMKMFKDVLSKMKKEQDEAVAQVARNDVAGNDDDDVAGNDGDVETFINSTASVQVDSGETLVVYE